MARYRKGQKIRVLSTGVIATVLSTRTLAGDQILTVEPEGSGDGPIATDFDVWADGVQRAAKD